MEFFKKLDGSAGKAPRKNPRRYMRRSRNFNLKGLLGLERVTCCSERSVELESVNAELTTDQKQITRSPGGHHWFVFLLVMLQNKVIFEKQSPIYVVLIHFLLSDVLYQQKKGQLEWIE